jgi:subtilisin family serine protease
MEVTSTLKSVFDAHSLTNVFARAGVTVFVIDDGIDTKHPDFEGRAKFGWTAIPSERNGPGGGHGKLIAALA